jgi:hypothetical protein
VMKTKSLKRQLTSVCRRELATEESGLISFTVLRKLVIGLAPFGTDEALRLTSLCNIEGVTEFLEATAVQSDPHNFGSASDYFRAAVVAAFLKKFPFSNVPGLDPLLTAQGRSAKAETLCRLTNKRLKYFRARSYRLHKDRRYVSQVLHLARLKIDRWLGDVNLGEIASNARHGPGGCIGVRRPATTEYYKYSAEAYTMTARCVPYVNALLRSDFQLLRALSGLGPFDDGPPMSVESILRDRCRVTDYNNVTYVPKTAQTHRAIAVEPMLNIYFQLGIGKTLRNKMRKIGLDLGTVWARNKNLALKGSLDDFGGDNKLSTIDLSMASDTLSIELVRDLLNPQWFDILSTFRSPQGKFEDGEKTWAKFSSMGNGFTFELETMVFYALALSLCEVENVSAKVVSCFGDDIILPSILYPKFADLLAYCGFSLNREKSFPNGHFRESCGGDYFDGWDVRPFYLKRELKTVPDLIFLSNSLVLLAEKLGGLNIDPSCAYECADYVRSRLPRIVTDHLLGSREGPIDGCLYTEFDLACKSHFVLWDRDIQQVRFPVLRQTAIRFTGMQQFVYLQFIGGLREQAAAFVNKWDRSQDLTTGSKSVVTQTERTVTSLKSAIAHHWV